MARSLTSGMEAAISGEVVRPILLLDLNFSSPIYFWSGSGTLTIGTTDYLGVGDLLNMSTIEETQDLGASGLTLELTGINGTTLLNKALIEDYQGNSVTLKLGALDDNNSLISDPVTMFAGFMDVLTIQEGGDIATISLKVENKLIKLNKAKVRRYTDQDQKADHSSDDGFAYVTNIAEKDIIWGQKSETASQSSLESIRVGRY